MIGKRRAADHHNQNTATTPKARHKAHVKPRRLDKTRQDKARQRQDKTRQDKTRKGKAKTRQDKDKTRQDKDKTRQDKARQETRQ